MVGIVAVAVALAACEALAAEVPTVPAAAAKEQSSGFSILLTL